jgi:hypothetical protein
MYNNIGKSFASHGRVDLSKTEYVRGTDYTSTVEDRWEETHVSLNPSWGALRYAARTTAHFFCRRSFGGLGSGGAFSMLVRI